MVPANQISFRHDWDGISITQKPFNFLFSISYLKQKLGLLLELCNDFSFNLFSTKEQLKLNGR